MTRWIVQVMRTRVGGALTILLAVAAGLANPATAAPGGAGPQSFNVPTDKGEVTGTLQGRLGVFLGIPFAAPPVGNLRLRPPQPHAPWRTPVAATQLPAPCIQGAVPAVVSGTVPPSEDCLYLNIWTPAFARSPRPVMVFIYGGGFRGGTGSVPYYSGTQIATQSDVVVVTFNYRVGPLGFLTVPSLDAESPAHVSGNYGFEDQQAALRWVRDNIWAFGGDPKNVTIFGESAGAISIEYHLISPKSSGLFEQAIIESSISGGAASTLSASEATAGSFVTSAGCATASDVAACLRAAPASAFTTGAFSPVVDGVVIPDQPLNAITAGHFNRVPTIMGSNHDEWTAYVWRTEAALGHPLTESDYLSALQAAYGADATAVAAAYPASAYPSPTQALAAAQTDSIVACPTEQTRQALKTYVPTYGYEFNEANPVPGALLGPPEPDLIYGDYHTVELAYVFGLDLSGTALSGNDASLSAQMIAYWGNMATSGDPNRPRRAVLHQRWPAYRSYAAILSLATPVTVETDFAQAHHCAFWAAQ